MSAIYELVGRLVVAFVRRRFGRQLQIAAGAAIAGGVVAAYLVATRDVKEG